MRVAPWLKITRREFIAEKRRGISQIRKVINNNLCLGCAIRDAFDGTLDFANCIQEIRRQLAKMDELTKRY